jgi:HK97 family phage prohead protease
MAADPKKPYGDVAYADPGYQSDGKKRYPLDTKAHVDAAWTYINQADNAAKYTAEQVTAIKGRIKAAGRKLGITYAEVQARSQQFTEQLRARMATRMHLWDDMTIRSDGGGRVVEAYMAVFAPARGEVMDQDGHYYEENASGFMTKTLSEKGLNVPVFYSHARTIDGFPSGELSIPVGVPVDIQPDGKGVFTAVRYLDNPLADSVLGGIKQRAIRGMSYSGLMLKSTKQRPVRRGGLPLITRHEVKLREFGPTALPSFNDAEIVGVRAQQYLRALLTAKPDDRVAQWLQQFEGTEPLAFGEPDAFPATPLGAGDLAEEPHQHSARSMSLRTRVHAARIARGISECTNGNQARGGDPHPSGDDRD